MEEMEKKDKPTPQTWQESLVLYLHDIAWLVAVIVVLFTVVFRVIVVSGDSMKQTLLDGDYLLLLSSVFYQEPEAGDIVVVSKERFDEGKPIVKRVIATEGQIVDINFETGCVYVDGIPLEEDYVNTPTNVDEGMAFPLIVEKGCIFVMGDNRNHSKDSRSPEIGLVDKREVLGKGLVLFLPGTDHGTRGRDFGRIGAIK